MRMKVASLKATLRKYTTHITALNLNQGSFVHLWKIHSVLLSIIHTWWEDGYVGVTATIRSSHNKLRYKYEIIYICNNMWLWRRGFILAEGKSNLHLSLTALSKHVPLEKTTWNVFVRHEAYTYLLYSTCSSYSQLWIPHPFWIPNTYLQMSKSGELGWQRKYRSGQPIITFVSSQSLVQNVDAPMKSPGISGFQKLLQQFCVHLL